MTTSIKALTSYAKGRTLRVKERLEAAMKTIELEIEQNSGIYPFHGGRLSLSEVCRRAGVHKVTIQGHSHCSTTKPMLEMWLAGIRKHQIVGSKTVRNTVTARANDWEGKYRAIAKNFNEMYAIEVLERDAKLKVALERIRELEAENRKLVQASSKGKIVSLSARRLSE